MLWNLVESSEIVLYCTVFYGSPQGGLTPYGNTGLTGYMRSTMFG